MAGLVQIIAAAQELGPEALLEFMRSGTRRGLREPQLDDPENGRRFIVTYASRLFGPPHAEELLKLKLYTAAADAAPIFVRRFVEAGMKDLNSKYEGRDRASVMAVLATLGDTWDREYAVKWFYSELNPDDGSSTPQLAFIHDLEFRKPREWRDIARRLVSNPAFEKLRSLDVMYLAMFVDVMEGGSVVPFRDDAAYNRQWLRSKFKTE